MFAKVFGYLNLVATPVIAAVLVYAAWKGWGG